MLAEGDLLTDRSACAVLATRSASPCDRGPEAAPPGRRAHAEIDLSPRQMRLARQDCDPNLLSASNEINARVEKSNGINETLF